MFFMETNSQKKKIWEYPIFSNPNYIATIWLLLALLSAWKQYATDKYNNYLIFKHVYYHSIEQLSLYKEYPELYFDHNHYGPLFGVLIAPFALLPDVVGMSLWNLFNVALLLWAVYLLPIETKKKSLILWISAHEFLTTALSFQFNPSIAAIIILVYVFIDNKKDFWAAMLIVAGTYIKLYGIVGLAFFFFSKDKLKFIRSLVFWAGLFFVLPMLLSSPTYVVNTYIEWYERLLVKNNENVYLSNMQDISLMGMVRKIFHIPHLSNLPFIIVGLLFFGLPYLRINRYKDFKFRLLLLSSVLIFTVIFSTGSESPTYIIAFMGIAIWFAIQEKVTYLTGFLLVFAILLTSLSPSDIFPRFVREDFIKPYALKALPCVLIWCRIVYEMLRLKAPEEIG